MIIGISGPIGAGKTTAGKYLSSKFALVYLRYSEVLKEMLGQENPDRSTLRNFGWELMSSGKQKHLNERLVSRMQIETSYVVDGLRHPLDLESLSNMPNQHFCLLYVEASPTIRWQRVGGRDRYETWEKFKKQDGHEVENKLPYLKEKANKILFNEGTLKDFELQLDNVMREIKGSVQR